ncbi:hypothetical protein [Streptomyces sp. NPDC055036]
MSIIVEIRKLTAEFKEVRTKHYEELDKYKDGPGGEVIDWVGYVDARARQDGADAKRYSELVLKLTELVGPDLKVGDMVVVPVGIATASGGFVGFHGEVTAEVLVLEDRDGDILVLAQGMEQYVDSRKVQLAE